MAYYDANYHTAKYVQKKPKGTSSGALKIYIPEIMPKISMGEPKTWTTGLNASIYNNAGDCKPSIASQTTLQNFVTAMEPYKPYEKPLFYFGDTLEITSRQVDILTCRLRSLDIDESKTT